MRVEGMEQMAPRMDMGAGDEVSAVKKEIQMLRKELGQLNQKKELSREEKQRKKDIEKEIAKLEQQLQKMKSEMAGKKLHNKEETEPPQEDEVYPAEIGKGRNVDERI